MSHPAARRAVPKDAVAIAGAGKVAQALGRLLAEKGVAVTAVGGRNAAHARNAASFIGRGTRPASLAELPAFAERILIAVSDRAVAEVAAILAAAGMKSGIAVHTCGSMGAGALAPLAEAGVAVGAFHPLQTFSSPAQGLGSLPGCVFAVDGDAPALAWAEQIARLLGGKTVLVPPEKRALYHAAAVMSGNYVISMLDAAAMLMSAAGFEKRLARQALGPLVETSVQNALREGAAKALSGPVQRGDLETVARHLEALKVAPESVRRLYCAAGLHTVRLAVRGGLAPERARELEALFLNSGIENV